MPGVGSSGEAPGLRPLDEMLAKALAARPGEVPVFMAFDNEQPSMTVTTAPRADSPATDMTIQILDRSTGDATSTVDRSEGRRVGKEGCRTGRFRCRPYN